MKLSLEQVASLCHEVNRQYCGVIGDHSQPMWIHAPKWQRDSAIEGVRARLSGPNSVPPSASHDSWLEQKRADGWKYGPVKDPAKKEHPCFVPYDQLPREQKVKDYLFCSVIESLRQHGMIEEVS